MDFDWLCHEMDKISDCVHGSSELSVWEQDRLALLLNIFIEDEDFKGKGGSKGVNVRGTFTLKVAEVVAATCRNPEALIPSLSDALFKLFEHSKSDLAPDTLTRSNKSVLKEMSKSLNEALLQINSNSIEPQTLARFKSCVKITVQWGFDNDPIIRQVIMNIGSEMVTRSLRDNFQGSLFMMPVITRAFPSLIPDLIRLLPLATKVENLNGSSLPRCLEIMCIMADHVCVEKTLRSICLDQFFEILALGLSHVESIVQKRALYLLKRTVDALSTAPIGNPWDCSRVHIASLEAQKALWNEYYLILESVDEKQGHIVKQVLGKLANLLSKTGAIAKVGTPFHVSWVLVVLDRLMVHNNQLIVKWTILFILSEFRLSDLKMNSGDFANLFQHILLPGLNSTKMICEDVLSDYGILHKFESFLTYWITSSNSDDNAWSLDIQNQDILCKGGTQELFLRILCKSCPCSEEALNSLIENFGPKGILIPGSKLWSCIQSWVTKHDSEVMPANPEYINKVIARSSNESSSEKRINLMKALALQLRLSEGYDNFFQSSLWIHVANLILDHADRVYSRANLDLLLLVGFLLEEPTKRDEGRADVLHFAEEIPLFSIVPQFQSMLRKTSSLAPAFQRSIERILFDSEELPEEPILKRLDLNLTPITNLVQCGLFPTPTFLDKSSQLFRSKSNAAVNSYSENLLISQWNTVLSLLKSSGLQVETSVCVKMFNLALEAIPKSGRFGLPVIFDALTHTLRSVKTLSLNGDVIQAVLELGWRTCADFRRNEAYWPCCRAFVDLAFCNSLLSMKDLTEYLEFLVENLFEESEAVPGLMGLFASRLRRGALDIGTDFPILNHSLSKLFLFGSSYKKDQQLQCEIVSVLVEDHLKGFGAQCVYGTDVHVPTLVRSLGHEIVSVLGPKLNHEALISKVRDLEKSVVGNKVRYFANSQVHLVKTRVLQVYLIMADFLPEKVGLQLGQDMISSILNDEFQTSVRYFTEWILIRLSKRFEALQEQSLQGLELAKQTRPGCVPSFLFVISHCLTLSVEYRMRRILPWTMSQHFATRLCAQLVFRRLYSNCSEEVKPVFEIMDICVAESLANGNMGKHGAELQTDFYLTNFDPEINFNPTDIFRNIPRLSLVVKTEWMWYSK
ncbi:hypothetical protein TCAL_00028 [Tigriopus californicus]|uniref:Uncharacterized protein n=1 Tax=Tigriopus californicus TaxID=6832 RepID=A0A553PHB6_TIGCA|nr:hypothetical protein TCAL_00028 [Tigriopus californicus]